MQLNISNVGTSIHVYGMSILKWCEVDQCSYVYVNIPKNASNWCKAHFRGVDFNYRTNTINDSNSLLYEPLKELWVKKKKFAIVLRDPYTRWISGLAQHLLGYRSDHPMFIDNLVWSNIFDQVVFDNHTEPQVKFIEGIDIEETLWFNCDPMLVDNFVSAFSSKFTDVYSETPTMPNAYNVTGENLDQQDIVNKITKILNNNPQWQQRIRNFYSKDYELINKVKFYSVL